MPTLTPTPTTDANSQHVAQKVIAFCASFAASKNEVDSSELIAEACKQFGIQVPSRAFQEIFEMRDEYSEAL